MIRNLLTKSFRKTLLGRWGRSTDEATTIKVNWANVDHCGTCSFEEVRANYTTNATIDDDALLPYFNDFPEMDTDKLQYKSVKQNK